VKVAHAIEVLQESVLHRAGQDRHAIPIARAFTHDNLIPITLDILHAQPHAFHQAQPYTVQQHCHGPGDTVKCSQHFGAWL
jgi:hypothetical protein